MAPRELALPGARPTEEGMQTVDTLSIRPPAPEVLASAQATRECFACYEGVVYIGHLLPLPDGDEEEVYTPYRCRLCSGSGFIAGEDL